jgi:nucleoside-diphosphate-sugar epimerase
MKILVTGGTGFIGNHVVRHLRADGHSVRALVRDKVRADRIHSLGAEIVEGDLSDSATLMGIANGMESIVHTAGLVGSGRGKRDDYFSANVDGTRALLAEAKRSGVGRFVQMSTVGVYGTAALSRDVPESTPYQRTNVPYSDSKVACEELVLASGIPSVIIRPYWISGGGDRFLIPQVAGLLRANKFTFIGGGDPAWSISAVENIGDAVALAATHPKAPGNIYNVADENVSISEIIGLIAQAIGFPPPTKHTPFIVAVLSSYFNRRPPRLTIDLLAGLWRGATFDTSKIRTELGWSPHIPWRDSIRQGAVEWLKENPA